VFLLVDKITDSLLVFDLTSFLLQKPDGTYTLSEGELSSNDNRSVARFTVKHLLT